MDPRNEESLMQRFDLNDKDAEVVLEALKENGIELETVTAEEYEELYREERRQRKIAFYLESLVQRADLLTEREFKKLTKIDPVLAISLSHLRNMLGKKD